MIIINNGDLNVYDLEGNLQTVNFPDGKNYLASTNEVSDFSFVTIADFTIIANAQVNSNGSDNLCASVSCAYQLSYYKYTNDLQD